MKKIILLLLIIPQFIQAQNLVVNGGFEIHSGLPVNYGEIYLATGWGNCSGIGTPDYFHLAGAPLTYFGTNAPRTDSAMAGFCTWHGSMPDFREYLSSQLSSPMTAGHSYRLSFWLAFGINGGYGFGSNNIGVCFSVGSLQQTGTSYIPVNPQFEITSIFYDTIWTQFTFQFIADSAYDYITICNFRDDASTLTAQYGVAYDAAYYFIDDVELTYLTVTALFIADNHVCPGTCTEFTNLSTNATSYQWFFPGGTPSTSTDVNPANICYTTPGSYDVTLIASNANGSDTTLLPNYIIVYPYSPSQSIIQSGDTLISNAGFVSYQWFFDGDTITGATDYFYVAMQSGDFSVVCLDGNGCSVEAVVLNVIASIQSTVDNQQPRMVYPNPADQFVVISSLFLVNPEEIQIYNVVGEVMPAVQLRSTELLALSLSKGELRTLDISHFPSGIYLLEIKSGEKLFRAKFIKQ